jgi:hypothetical protein
MGVRVYHSLHQHARDTHLRDSVLWAAWVGRIVFFGGEYHRVKGKRRRRTHAGGNLLEPKATYIWRGVVGRRESGGKIHLIQV